MLIFVNIVDSLFLFVVICYVMPYHVKAATKRSRHLAVLSGHRFVGFPVIILIIFALDYAFSCFLFGGVMSHVPYGPSPLPPGPTGHTTLRPAPGAVRRLYPIEPLPAPLPRHLSTSEF